jgi:hypothetical protein
MDSVRRIFLLFLALLSFENLYSDSRQAFFSSPIAARTFSLFEENGKVGLKNDQGQILIPAQHEAIGWSNGEFSVVGNVTGYRMNNRWGLINIQNSKLTKAEFEDLSPGEGTLLVARKKIPGTVRIQSGCINTSGKEIIPFQYDGLQISAFRAIVYTRNGTQFKHGLIDFENKLLIPLIYQNIYSLGSLRYGVENFESKTAIFSEDGKQITNFLIDSLSSFKKDYAVFYQNQRQGLIDRQGQIKLEPVLREIVINDDGSVNMRKADSWLFLEGDNKLVRQVNADSITVMSNDLLKINTAGKSQLTNKEFKPVSDQLFSFIGPFKNGKAFFKNRTKTGIIDRKGKILVKPVYQTLITDAEFIRAVQRIDGKDRWVLLDSSGNSVSAKNFEYIGAFNGNFFPIKNRGYWGALSREGKERVACVHDSLVQTLDKFIVVKFKGNYGIVNLNEDWIATPQSNKLKLLNDTRYLLITPKTTFLKSMDGQVIYFSDNRLEFNSDHMLEYLPSGMIWKVDFNGVITDRFSEAESVQEISKESEGLRAMKRDGRYGFIDNRNRLRIANRYEAVKDFSETLAAVRIRGKWGFINHEDQIAIQPVYDEVVPFKGNFSLVRQKDFYALIDRKGKLTLPARYESIVVLPDNRFQVKQNGLWGLADASGKMIINPKYDLLTDLNNGYVIVARDGKFGLLNIEGVSTIPLLYDGLSFDPYHNLYMAVKKAEWEKLEVRSQE